MKNKKMKNKNRIRILSLSASLFLSAGLLAGCGGNTSDSNSDPNHYDLGDYALDYKGASIMSDYEGKDALVLTLDYTNNGDDAESYLWSISEKAYQDGVQLETAVVYLSEDSFDTVMDTQGTEIQPGKTVEVKTAFELRDSEQEVQVTFSELLGSKKAELTIDPTKLEHDDSNLSTDSVSSESATASSDPAADAAVSASGTGAAVSMPDTTGGDSGEDTSAEPFVEAGDGMTTKETLVSAYNHYSELSLDERMAFTYDDLVSLIGVNGKPNINKDWSEEKQMYCWYGEGTNVILTQVLKKQDDGTLMQASIAITGDY